MHSGQASFLKRANGISSCCTGVYTVECAAAMIEKTVNETSSPTLGFDVYLQSKSCFEPCWDNLSNGFVLFQDFFPLLVLM